jgi:hypothetical protein
LGALPTLKVQLLSDELARNAQEHAAVLADYLAGRLQSGGMAPDIAADLLAEYVARSTKQMIAMGATREEGAAWAKAVLKAFDKRVIEMIESSERERR